MADLRRLTATAISGHQTSCHSVSCAAEEKNLAEWAKYPQKSWFAATHFLSSRLIDCLDFRSMRMHT